MRWTHAGGWLVLAALAGCEGRVDGGTTPAGLVDDGADGGAGSGDGSGSVDDDPSGADDGETADTAASAPTEVTADGVVLPVELLGQANPDDDDGNGQYDWFDGLFPEDDDVVSLTVQPSPNGAAAGVDGLSLALAGDLADIRVYHDGQPILGPNSSSHTLPWQADPIELVVEFRRFLVLGELTVTETASGAVASEATTELWSGPMVLNHHLQPTEAVWSTAIDTWYGDNNAFIAGYQAALGSTFTAVPGPQYDNDPWIQDEFEFATCLSPDADRLDIVIDSIRDRGLDDYPEDALQEPDRIPLTWGNGWANSQDSFGNLETSPPVTVNGTHYPFGRIYYGALGGGFGPHPALRAILADQVVQEPFEVDTSWLCVGHVDEWMTFIPDPAAPKGFWFVYTDIDLAYDILEAMPPGTQLPQYASPWNGHGYGTVGQILNDGGLQAYNEDLRDLYLEPIKTQMMTELGLDAGDVIEIPGLFEAVSDCGNTAAAMIPAMANLVVVNEPGDPIRIFLADPFLRTDLSDQSTDPMIQAVEDVFPATHELYFLDDWDVYHMGLGEVHCGTNVQRTPTENWWDVANDLLGRTTP